jgi:phosphopantetheinyl transferase
VGVAVQVARPRAEHIAIAARAFGPDEARRLQTLDAPQRGREFLRAWVRHEAALKCLATGIAGAPRAVCTSEEAPQREPWICSLEIGAGAAGAVASQRRPRELRCWEWRAAEQPRPG